MSGTRPSGNFYTNFKNSKRSQNSQRLDLRGSTIWATFSLANSPQLFPFIPSRRPETLQSADVICWLSSFRLSSQRVYGRRGQKLTYFRVFSSLQQFVFFALTLEVFEICLFPLNSIFFAVDWLRNELGLILTHFWLADA